jgi:hypothetical protein
LFHGDFGPSTSTSHRVNKGRNVFSQKGNGHGIVFHEVFHCQDCIIAQHVADFLVRHVVSSKISDRSKRIRIRRPHFGILRHGVVATIVRFSRNHLKKEFLKPARLMMTIENVADGDEQGE